MSLRIYFYGEGFWKMGSMSGLHGLVYLPFQEWIFHVDNYRSSISRLIPIRLQGVKSNIMLSCLNHEKFDIVGHRGTDSLALDALSQASPNAKVPYLTLLVEVNHCVLLWHPPLR